MAESDTTMGGTGRVFPTTMWSAILQAADPASPACREQLAQLVKVYWKPVYAYIRTSWRKPVEEAKDLTQAFFAHLLQRDYLARLRPERGSFRGYLKEALRHFLIDANRAEQARRPDKPLFPLEAMPGELDRLGPAAPDESPERAYERAWFRCVIEASVEDLKRQLAREGKELYFQVFEVYCLGAPDDIATPLLSDKASASMTYRDVADRLGLQETDVRNYLNYSRRLLRQLLRARIRETVATDEDVDHELQELGLR